MLSASLNPMVPFVLLYEVWKPCLEAPEVIPRNSGFGSGEFGRSGGRRAGVTTGRKSL